MQYNIKTKIGTWDLSYSCIHVTDDDFIYNGPASIQFMRTAWAIVNLIQQDKMIKNNIDFMIQSAQKVVFSNCIINK